MCIIILNYVVVILKVVEGYNLVGVGCKEFIKLGWFMYIFYDYEY